MAGVFLQQLIFFTESEFTKRDFDRLGIQKLMDAGLDVRVYDLSYIYFPGLVEGNAFKFSGYNQIKNISDFKAKMKKDIKAGYFFWIGKMNYKILPYYLSLPTDKLKKFELLQGHLPFVHKTKKQKIFDNLKIIINPAILFLKIELFLAPKIVQLFSSNEPTAAYFCAGKKVEQSISEKEKVISVGTFDYNLFLKNPPSLKQEFIVFLDENEPFHPDFDRQKIKKISPEKYYRELAQVFEHFEKKHGVPVVIAAHPSSDPKTYSANFGGRSVRYGATVELTRDALGVIAHTSTAIQFAFLYKKPLCCFMNEKMINGYRKNLKKAYENLGFRFVNMSHPLEIEKAEFRYDKTLALGYLKDMVVSNLDEKQDTWEKVIAFIRGQ